jgi:hypothetical protein
MLLGLILSPVLLLGALLQVYFDRTVTRGEAYLERIRPEEMATARVLILGDSHVRDALPDQELPSYVVNLAFGGDSIKEVYLKALYALEQAPQLHCVVLQCDYHVLSDYRLAANNRFMTFYFSEPDKINRLYAGTDLTPLKRRLFVTLPVLYGPNRAETVQVVLEDARRGTLFSTPRAEPAKIGNWSLLEPSRRVQEAGDRVGRQFRRAPVAEELAELLAELMAVLEKKGIRVLCVRYPVTREYLEALQTQIDLDVVRGALDVGPPSLHLDYSSLYHERPELFHNQDHLNSNGAPLFARELLRAIAIESCEEPDS